MGLAKAVYFDDWKIIWGIFKVDIIQQLYCLIATLATEVCSLQTCFPIIVTWMLSLSLIFACVCGSFRLGQLSLVVQLSLLCSCQVSSKEAQLDTAIPIGRFMQDQLRGLWPVYGLTPPESGSNHGSSVLFLSGSLQRRGCRVMCVVGIPVVGLSRTVTNHLRNVPKKESYSSCPCWQVSHCW